MIKNVAGQKIGCQMNSATDGSAFTSTVTVYVTLDAGTQAIGTVGSGVCAHEGNGYHTYAPSQAETNGDLVAFTFIGTGAIPQTVQCATGYPQSGDAYAKVDTEIATLQTSVDDLPTNAELATALGTADDAVLAAISALNNLSEANVQSAMTSQGYTSTRAGYLDTLDGIVAAIWAYTNALPVAGTAFAHISGVASSIATLSSKIGSFAGSGVNTVLGFFLALMKKDASTPSDIGGTFDPATDSVEALREKADALSTQTSVDDIPTNAELATALASADDATLAAIAALPTAAQNAAGLLDLANGVETGYTPRQALRLILSALAGKLSGAATTTVAIRNVTDAKDRITATVDADGNRTAVTLDVS